MAASNSNNTSRSKPPFRILQVNLLTGEQTIHDENCPLTQRIWDSIQRRLGGDTTSAASTATAQKYFKGTDKPGTIWDELRAEGKTKKTVRHQKKTNYIQ